MGFQHFNSTILKAASRKGGKIRISKGFGKDRQLAAEAGRKGGLRKHENRSKETRKEEGNPSGNNNLLERVLTDIGDGEES